MIFDCVFIFAVYEITQHNTLIVGVSNDWGGAGGIICFGY
jgi:hypothetical protein